MPLLQGLIFDLDGTLMDSAPDLRHSVNLTLKAHSRRLLSLEEVTDMVGDGMLALLKRAFAATGEPVDDAQSYSFFQEFLTHYRSQKPDPSQIYPHVLDVLQHFQNAGVKLGICTNKQEAATHQLLEELNMKKYFTFIAGGDTFPVHKPNPGHVIGAIKNLGVPAANCVMVGDSSNDVLAAHGADIPSIVVTYGYGGNLQQIGAKSLIQDFSELPAALHELGFTYKH